MLSTGNAKGKSVDVLPVQESLDPQIPGRLRAVRDHPNKTSAIFLDFCTLVCQKIHVNLDNTPYLYLWTSYLGDSLGEISFVSKSFGGRTTDSELTVKSGFVNLVQPGDTIMADKACNS